MDIGESIPLFAQYEHVLNDKSQMHVVLEYVYTDVMDFHSSAIRYFKSPGKIWTPKAYHLQRQRLTYSSVETDVTCDLEDVPLQIRTIP